MGNLEKELMKDPMLKHYSLEWVQELVEKGEDSQFVVDVVQDEDNQDEKTSQIQ